MSYTAPDFSDEVIWLLGGRGYQVHENDANGESWFTWTENGFDIEVGDNFRSSMEAWGDAALHWFTNANISAA